MGRFPGWSPYPLRNTLAKRRLRQRIRHLSLKCERCAFVDGVIWGETGLQIPSDSYACNRCLRNPHALSRTRDNYRTVEQIVEGYNEAT